MTGRKRLFILDTNVLLHDPAALFRFMEHDIYIPMVVLEELDNGKKGMSEVARNARQTSRFLDEIISRHSNGDFSRGLSLTSPFEKEPHTLGRLFFEIHCHKTYLPADLPGNLPDNSILNTSLGLVKEWPDRQVILISKDINLRIKAKILGLTTEDYTSDKTLDDVKLLYSGIKRVDAAFWEQYGDHLTSTKNGELAHYTLNNTDTEEWLPNQCLVTDNDALSLRVKTITNTQVTLEEATCYRNQHHVWGINARNMQQNFALNLLMDPAIDFVSLVGMAGTGKTLLTLAAALEQTIEQKRYREILMTRVTVSVGEDIGFLPGTEEEKMTPWMGALMDNLEVLTGSEQRGEWEKAASNDLLSRHIKVRSLNFMRGRTFLNKFLIIDEAQNLTAQQMKTLITRAGPGTKVVCLGNVAQIDTPYLTETTSGLTYVVNRFKGWQHSAHITLTRGERSRLADQASNCL